MPFYYWSAEVLLLDNEVAVFRSGTECKFYIAGPVEEVRKICFKFFLLDLIKLLVVF